MMRAVSGLVYFVIDARASLFTVQALASGIVAVVAHSPKFAIRDIDGAVEFLPDTLQSSSLHMTINATSLEIMDEVGKADRREIERVMFDEVLEKNSYPKIEYQSSRATAAKTAENTFRVNIAGDLTLHGTTRGLGVEAQVVAGEDTLRAQGAFTLLQSDFGLRIASVAGGTLKLQDELKFSFFILCRRHD